jgi:hypothetical protein
MNKKSGLALNRTRPPVNNRVKNHGTYVPSAFPKESMGAKTPILQPG